MFSSTPFSAFMLQEDGESADMGIGLFRRFFNLSGPPPEKSSGLEDIMELTQGGFFEVVGEAQYQRELEDICGGRGMYSAEHQCRAVLIPEPNNPVDPNAVQIVVDRRVVAYLSRHHAVEYQQHIGMRASCCNAKIVGGWDDGQTVGHFGVKLKIKWPPKPRKA